MIILEGADGSGKSVLANLLHHRYRRSHEGRILWSVQGGEGPAKNEMEIDRRIDRFLALPQDTIFDRHPVISETVYGSVFNRPKIRSRHWFSLSLLNPLVIYCRSPSGELPVEHNNPHADTPEYIAELTRLHPRVLHAYEEYFARVRPAVVYTWDNPREVTLLCDVHVAHHDGLAMLPRHHNPSWLTPWAETAPSI